MENWSSGAVDGLECASKDQDKPNPPVARAHDADAINRWPEGNGFNSLGPNLTLDFVLTSGVLGIVPDALSLSLPRSLGVAPRVDRANNQPAIAIRVDEQNGRGTLAEMSNREILRSRIGDAV